MLGKNKVLLLEIAFRMASLWKQALGLFVNFTFKLKSCEKSQH